MIQNKTWQALLRLAVVKQAYAVENNRRKALPPFQRLLATLKGGILKDPVKGFSVEALANAYVNAFRKERGGGLVYLDGDASNRTISAILRFNSGTALPVYSLTYYDGTTAFQTRRAFRRDGGWDEWGCGYPISEMGVTGMPNPIPEDIRKHVSIYEHNMELIAEVLRTI